MERIRSNIKHFFKVRSKNILTDEKGLLVIAAFLLLIFALASPTFATINNLLNITRQVSIVLIVSLGMLCVVLSGEIDLSVGSMAAFAGVTCAFVMSQTGSVFLGVITALVAGLAIGLINGLFVVYGKIPSFIVTLSMMWVVRGVALMWTGGRPISGLPIEFSFIGAGYLGMIPVSTLLCFFLIIVAYFGVHKTKHGVYFKSIGSNLESAILSAIPVKRYKVITFVTSGLMSSIGGILITSRLLSAQPVAAQGMEMDVLAAVILGGTSLSGGVGTVVGTVIGAVTIGIINNGMNLLGVSAFFQQVVKGSIIIIAVLIRQRNKK